ncbi:nuclear transport factor 2 family protein [Fischerella thermalis]|uniref:nuclear transport factor 2 family protein n=1 Tax=Fischerella thermalis TaxID=372787 RepID=UPI001A0ABA7B|nr:nuclear transport factor 2 family protein [Fischerella thermalis]MBF1989302.1 nuclear transport factor 2 family protein [Fischerella thermalis M58_A2018_009]MBF2060533.1 nuclear transport factor 2 family protein [Fischerella thermalis M66_A2018_004]MBF2070677.1 nuclear transport factor 2 family protein [Fischerella thermalis M48_A2018_028]
MISKEEIANLIANYFSNIAAMNAEGWIANFAEDAISYDPVGEPATKIHENFRAFINQLKTVFNTLEATTEHIFITGNEAAVKWTMQGISKTDKSVTFEGITVFEINNFGKIQTTRAYWNPALMLAQLRS